MHTTKCIKLKTLQYTQIHIKHIMILFWLPTYGRLMMIATVESTTLALRLQLPRQIASVTSTYLRNRNEVTSLGTCRSRGRHYAVHNQNLGTLCIVGCVNGRRGKCISDLVLRTYDPRRRLPFVLLLPPGHACTSTMIVVRWKNNILWCLSILLEQMWDDEWQNSRRGTDQGGLGLRCLFQEGGKQNAEHSGENENVEYWDDNGSHLRLIVTKYTAIHNVCGSYMFDSWSGHETCWRQKNDYITEGDTDSFYWYAIFLWSRWQKNARLTCTLYGRLLAPNSGVSYR